MLLARQLGLEPAHLRHLADRMDVDAPTLGAVLAVLPESADIARRYPQGWAVLLHGRRPRTGPVTALPDRRRCARPSARPDPEGISDRHTAGGSQRDAPAAAPPGPGPAPAASCAGPAAAPAGDGRARTNVPVEPVEGLAELPLTEFTLARCQRMVHRYRVLVAAELPGGRAGRSRSAGASAAQQLCHALHAVDKALARHHYLAGPHLGGLDAPPRPGAAREKSMTDTELRQWIAAILRHSRDPELDVALWLLHRIMGARPCELRYLRVHDVNLQRGAVSLVGRGGRVREMPVHVPVLLWIVAVMAARAPAPGGQLLRGGRGGAVGKNRTTKWTLWLKADQPWAQPHRFGPYAMRHAAGRELNRATGATGPAGLYLGHTGAAGFRVSETYAHPSSPSGVWENRCALAERLWGPLTGWPLLPEADVLRLVLPDLPAPTPVPQPDRLDRPDRPDQPDQPGPGSPAGQDRTQKEP